MAEVPSADKKAESEETVASTSSADTKEQNGKATRRRREYPPATEVLQTQVETPKKAPVLPSTTNESGTPIKDHACVDLAIALAKLDLTCSDLLDLAARYGTLYRKDRDTHSKDKDFEYPKSTVSPYTAFRPYQKTLKITDADIKHRVRDLLDIDRSVSMIIGQEYLSNTEISRYWELLTSAFVFLVMISEETVDSIFKCSPLPVEAEQVRQTALIVARKGALDREIRIALRQRWLCIDNLVSHTKNRMSHELHKDMLSSTLLVDLGSRQIAGMPRQSSSRVFSCQMIAEDRRRQAETHFAKPNARVVLLMWSAFTATLLTAIPTMALGWRFSPHKRGNPADADFWFLWQNCAMTFLGLIIMILPTFQAESLPCLTKTTLWIWIGFAAICVVVAPIAYLYLPTEGSQCLIMISGAIQIFVTLQLSLTAAEGAKKLHEKTS